MAITERYVTTTAAGGGDGSSGSPWTLTEAATNAVAGDRINVKAGTYTLAANLSPTNAGTAVSPIIWRGYNASIGDLETQGRSSGNGNLDTTNFPVIACGSSYRALMLKAYSIVESMSFTGSYNGPVLVGTTTSVFHKCYAINSGTGASAVAITGMLHAIGCDAELSGASGGTYAIECAVNYGSAIGCRVRDSQAGGIRINSGGIIAVFNVVDADGVGIDFTNTTISQPFSALCNTIFAGTIAIRIANAAYTAVPLMLGNHCTDASGYSIDSLYAATANIAAAIMYNRFRDNTSGNSNGFADWAMALASSNVTTDTGDAATDFANAAGGDFNLIGTAPALAASVVKYLDCGALQHNAAIGACSMNIGGIC